MPPVTNSIAPAADGGGATSTAPASTDQLVPMLQQLATALQGLATALQGSGLVTGGGGAATAPSTAAGMAATGATGAMGAMGAPSASGGGASDMAGMKGMPGMQGGKGAKGMPGMKAKGAKGMSMVQRDRPDDPARAQKVLASVYEMFGTRGRAGLDFKNNQTHGYLSAAQRAEFTRRYNLPAPQSLVFRPGSNTPLGAVWRNNEGPFDLGMGNRHVHDDNPKSQMQHVWFTPDNLQFAFSDIANGMTQGVAAAMKKLGYPV